MAFVILIFNGENHGNLNYFYFPLDIARVVADIIGNVAGNLFPGT